MAADPEECARRALAWLQRRAGIRRGVCLATRTSEGPRLVPLASIGVPAARLRGFSVDLEARDHPLTQVLFSSRPIVLAVEWSAPRSPRSAPRRSRPFRCAPCEPNEPPAGLLLLTPLSPAGAADARGWDACSARGWPRSSRPRISRKPGERLRRERTLLYSIINAVTDPILLTDADGPHHDRQRARRDAAGDRRGPERGPAPGGRAEQHAVLGGAVAPRAGRRGGAAPRGAAGRSGRRLRPAVRAAEHGDQRRARGRPASSRCCATSPTCSGPPSRSRRTTAGCARPRPRPAPSATGSTSSSTRWPIRSS